MKEQKNDLRTWRAIVAERCPPVAPVLFAATYIEDGDDKNWPKGNGTFCVNPDTLVIRYHPEFVQKHSIEDNAFVLAHEGGHVLCDHVKRRKEMAAKEGIAFQPHIFIMAEEMAVNAMIASLGEWKVPEGGVECPTDFISLSTEEIYHELCRTAKRVDIKVPGNCIDPSATGANANEGVGMLKNQAQGAAARGVTQGGKNAGEIAGELRRLTLAGSKYDNPADFRKLLKRVLIAFDFSSQDFDAASIYRRRADMDGLLCPNLSTKPTGRKFVLSIDNSGSVNDEMWSALKGVMQEVAQQLGFQEIIVQHFTSQVIATETLHSIAQLKAVARRGDGGTSIVDCDAKAAIVHPQFHVILTDGYVDHWLSRYSVPTVIVRTCSDSEVPPKVDNLIAEIMAEQGK